MPGVQSDLLYCEPDESRTRRRARCRKGGVTFHHSKTPHMTTANTLGDVAARAHPAPAGRRHRGRGRPLPVEDLREPDHRRAHHAADPLSARRAADGPSGRPVPARRLPAGPERAGATERRDVRRRAHRRAAAPRPRAGACSTTSSRRPADAIDTLSGIDDPMIGVYAHWVYGPHTTDGVVGSDTPLLLASNFDGTWPGLVGLLNTGACLTSLGRAHSRLWSDARRPHHRRVVHGRARHVGAHGHDRARRRLHPRARPRRSSRRVVDDVLAGMRAKRPLAAMLGDTSMGMINGYFGPQRLARVGFSEHKIDQAWVIEQGKTVDARRVDDALAFVRDRGVEFHYGDDFDEQATREPAARLLRGARPARRVPRRLPRLAVPARPDPLAAAVGLRRGPAELRVPAGDERLDDRDRDRSRPGQPGADGDAEAAPAGARPARVGRVPRRALGRRARRPLRVGAAELRVRPARTRSTTTPTRCAACTPTGSRPRTSRSPAARSRARACPGAITWARAWLDGDELVMDVGRGEVVALPPSVRDAWWEGTTRQWPFMAADLRHQPRRPHGALPEQPRRGRVRRRVRRHGRALAPARLPRPRAAAARDRPRDGRCSASTSAPAARAPGCFDDRRSAASAAASTRSRSGNPSPTHVEQSSDDIWHAVVRRGSRARIEAAAVAADAVVGIGFDATCSLVAIDAQRRSRSRSARDGDDRRNVIVWMDHRAIDDAAAIDATEHPVLQFVGGSISPEMETPKLRWVQAAPARHVAPHRALVRPRPTS